MNGIKLYVDDLREAPDKWVCVRTITEASRLLSAGLVSEVSLDHDICWSLPPSLLGHEDPEEVVQETYFALVYLLIHLPRRLRPTRVNIHTANPDAAKAMGDILKENKYKVTMRSMGGKLS